MDHINTHALWELTVTTVDFPSARALIQLLQQSNHFRSFNSTQVNSVLVQSHVS